MVIFETIFLGFIICVPMLWVAKLKTDLNITNHKLDGWRELAIKLNKNERLENGKTEKITS
mgnify:CR=1 FL=1